MADDEDDEDDNGTVLFSSSRLRLSLSRSVVSFHRDSRLFGHFGSMPHERHLEEASERLGQALRHV